MTMLALPTCLGRDWMRRVPASLVRLAAMAVGLPCLATAAPAGAPGPRIHPGIYLSESVALTLANDGSFGVQELGGIRHAAGRYRLAPGRLTFATGQGDVGQTRFPLQCRLASAFDGFAIVPDQAECRPFSGLSFRTAN